MRQTIRAAAAILMLAAPLSAQRARPFEITDNSFLVEEAFNQEAGVFQNIIFFHSAGPGEVTFTQEWPMGGMRHQFSYSVTRSERWAGTVNYRLQLTDESAGRPALSPRATLLIEDELGAQFNLPVSKQFGDVFLHGNAGVTMPGFKDATSFIAASAILRVKPMFNLMVETVYENSLVVSPGVRGGWNIGDKQLILGAAVPIGSDETAFIAYLSYELPFR
jgi:hypothetical protein